MDQGRLLQNHGPLDGVAQFAHVAGPVVRKQQLGRVVADPFDAALEFAVVMVDEETRHRHNIFAPLAQRRNQNLDHVEAEIKVLPEGAFLDRFAQVLVGGRHHPQIQLDVLQAAQPPEALLFQYPQQLGLQHRGDFADLVQK